MCVLKLPMNKFMDYNTVRRLADFQLVGFIYWFTVITQQIIKDYFKKICRCLYLVIVVYFLSCK